MRWVIGDIHGMLRPLRPSSRGRAGDADCRFIFVGDYINRGPNSKGVIDLLLSLDNASFIRGNHDDIFDLVLHEDCYICDDTGPDAISAFKWFSHHGLMSTLQSYGLDYAEVESVVKRPSLPRLRQLVSVVPDAHRKFVRTLHPYLEFDDMFVVHAMWDPDLADDFEPLASNARMRHRLLWGRYSGDELRRAKRWRRTGYFGHTPVMNYGLTESVPVRGPKIVMLDTGAALGSAGRLSAVSPQRRTHPERSRRQSAGADMSEERANCATSVDLCRMGCGSRCSSRKIAPNTGNIARLCVATGSQLDLVRPLGFVLDDRALRRSAMDYWPRLGLTVHDGTESFFQQARAGRLWLFSSKGCRSHWDVRFQNGDSLVFGNETHGISSDLLERHRDHVVRIPQAIGRALPLISPQPPGSLCTKHCASFNLKT